jgi:hypothetical protein
MTYSEFYKILSFKKIDHKINIIFTKNKLIIVTSVKQHKAQIYKCKVSNILLIVWSWC